MMPKRSLVYFNELGELLLDEVLYIDRDSAALAESKNVEEAGEYLDLLDARVQNCLMYIQRLRKRMTA